MKLEMKSMIDELAKIRAQIKPLAKREDEIKEKIKTLGVGVHRGISFYAIIEERSRGGFDSVALRAELPEQVWQPYWKETDFLLVSVKPATIKTAPKRTLQGQAAQTEFQV